MGHRQRLLDAPNRRQMMSDGVQHDVPGSKSSATSRPTRRWNIATVEEDAGVIINEHEYE